MSLATLSTYRAGQRSQGSHERHGGGGVDAEEAHVDRGVDVCC